MLYEQTKWLLCMQSCDDFLRFREINQTLAPSVIWKTALDHPKTLESMTFLAKVTCKPSLSIPTICLNCDEQYRDELYHKLFECSCEVLETVITSYWTYTKSQFSDQIFTYLKNCDNTSLVLCILGKVDETITELLTIDQHRQFMNINAAFLKAVYAV